MEFHETLLPSLTKNIVCGNSLIGTDILSGHLFDPSEERKLNPMDFKQRFPDIIAAGGFDAIVGNPPWGAQLKEAELEYLRNRNREIIVRMIDSFMYFIHHATQLIRDGGMFGMILPDVLLYQIDNRKLREHLVDNVRIHQILNMGDVFEEVTRPACILIFGKDKPDKQAVTVANYTDLSKQQKILEIGNQARFSTLLQREIRKTPGSLFLTARLDDYRIWHKIQSKCRPLRDFVDADGIQRGVSPDFKEAFLVDAATSKKWNLEASHLRPTLTGGTQIKRFHIEYPDLCVIYTTRDTVFSQIPNICAYIDSFGSKITCKEVKTGKHSLYALHRAREERIFTKQSKIVGVITEDEVIVASDEKLTFPTDGVYLFGVAPGVNEKFLLGVLNSTLFVFLYRLLAIEEGRVLAQVKPTTLVNLPIPSLNLQSAIDRQRHNEIVHLVEQVSTVKGQLVGAHTDANKDFYGNKCDGLMQQIDDLVFSLYQLNESDRTAVKKSAKQHR
jgi:hypothetical protein